MNSYYEGNFLVTLDSCCVEIFVLDISSRHSLYSMEITRHVEDMINLVYVTYLL